MVGGGNGSVMVGCVGSKKRDDTFDCEMVCTFLLSITSRLTFAETSSWCKYSNLLSRERVLLIYVTTGISKCDS